MVSYLLLGMVIGVLTGVPVGPVNVAVIDAAYRHNLRRAIAVGIGGAIADMAYAGLGILGVGPILKRHPAIPPVLYAISGAVLTVYGILTVRARPIEPSETPAPGANDRGHMWAGFLVGVLLIFMNPAAIVTWVLIVGSFMSEVTFHEGLASALGVGVGSLAWFTLIAWLSDHGKRVLGGKAVYITRVVGVLLIGYGMYSLGRAAVYVARHVG